MVASIFAYSRILQSQYAIHAVFIELKHTFEFSLSQPSTPCAGRKVVNAKKIQAGGLEDTGLERVYGQKIITLKTARIYRAISRRSEWVYAWLTIAFPQALTTPGRCLAWFSHALICWITYTDLRYEARGLPVHMERILRLLTYGLESVTAALTVRGIRKFVLR